MDVAESTLDAGCGNGALSYAAYRKGSQVVAISNDTDQLARNRDRFGIHVGDRIAFAFTDLRLLDSSTPRQDQIICSETLEHIADDSAVIRGFASLLAPTGVLHLCCPNAAHPEHCLGRRDEPEDGGHVRDGYTIETYTRLLETSGFRIVEAIGIGSPLVVSLDRVLRRARHAFGEAASVPLFAILAPIALLRDREQPLDSCYSIYVRAVLSGHC